MRKSKLSVLALAAVLLVVISLLVGCAPEATPTSTQEPTSTEVEPMEFKYATNRPPADPQSEEWIKPMLNEIEEKTDGRVTFKVYWSEALGGMRDQYNLVKDGVADMTDFATFFVPGKFALADVANLPFAAQDPANLSQAMLTLSEEGYFDSMWDEVEWLSWHSTPPYRFLFREAKPTKYEELAGLKARAPGGLATECLGEIGMVPVTVSAADAYTAWQTGLVDVWVHPAGAVTKYKLYELPTRAFLNIAFYTTANGACIFNKDKFNSLSAEDQETMKEVVQEYSWVYLESGLDTEEEAISVMEETGIEVYSWPESELNKLKEASVPIYEKFVSDLEEKGLPGREMVNRFIEILEELGENPPSLD